MNRKPENLCRTAEDQIKISDFGVSYLITEQGTKKRSGLGTPAFTAPEALSTINGNSFSPQLLDIWALGITLYCFVFGRCPFIGESLLETFKFIQENPLTFPDSIPVSDELKDLLSRILEKNPAKRLAISEIKKHPWITENDTFELKQPSDVPECLVEVSNEEVAHAVLSTDSLAQKKAKMASKILLTPS